MKRNIEILFLDGEHLGIDPFSTSIDQVNQKCFKLLSSTRQIQTAYLVFVRIKTFEDGNTIYFMWKNRIDGLMKFVEEEEVMRIVNKVMKNL